MIFRDGWDAARGWGCIMNKALVFVSALSLPACTTDVGGEVFESDASTTTASSGSSDGPGTGSSSGESSSESGGSTTGATGATGTSSGGSTGASGGSTGGPGSSGSSGTTGTDGTDGSSSGLGTTTFGTGSSSGSTGGGEPVCPVVSGDYGACQAVLGWGFNGEDCQQYSGCDCGADCANLHQEIDGCTASCEGMGFCDESVFDGFGLAPDGWDVGQYCDDLSVCVASDVVPLVQALVPGAMCAPDAGLCNKDSRCVLEYGAGVSPYHISLACELSLVPGIDAVTCSVY